MERVDNIKIGLKYIRTATLAKNITNQDLEDIFDIFAGAIKRVKDGDVIHFFKKCAFEFDRFPTAKDIHNYSHRYYNNGENNDRL
jgi:hypothetical protein